MSDVMASGGCRPGRRPTLTKKDFTSDQEPRWCPGCGDYAILSAVQGFMPELGIEPHKTVFVSGIGCSGRFTYYMDTYGMHGIHGRAPALATGIAVANPELSVWVVTGDGDGLSIGGNHLIHALRRNVDIKILLFNNQIYGLTKGQYSPTSEEGKVTKSTPFGSVDHPFNPIALALGVEATFVARTLDNDRQHLTEVLRRAAQHKGTAFIEIYQNCNVFNDGAFDLLREKAQGKHNQIRLEHGEPIMFDDGNRCVRVGENGRYEIAPTVETDPERHRRARRARTSVATVRTRTPRERARRAIVYRGLPRGRASGVRPGDPAPAASRDRASGRRRPGEAPSLRRYLDGGVDHRRSPADGWCSTSGVVPEGCTAPAPRMRRSPSAGARARSPRARPAALRGDPDHALPEAHPEPGGSWEADLLEDRGEVFRSTATERTGANPEAAVVERHHQRRRIESGDAEAHQVRRPVRGVPVDRRARAPRSRSDP